MLGRYTHASDGTRLYYEIMGDAADAPVVLLIMGLGFAGEVWAHTRDRLVERGYRAITMDNRGMGRSDVPHNAFSTAVMGGDAVAVLDAAGVQRAHVVGLSLGGMIAQQVALHHPQRVRALVLQSTTGGIPRLDFVSATGVARALALVRGRLGRQTADERARALLRLLTTADYAEVAAFDEPRLAVYVAALQAKISMDGWLAQVRAASTHSSWSGMAQIAAPTLIQHGAGDRVVRVAAGRAIAARIPGARLEIYEGAGHLLALQRPDSLDGLLRFLDEQDDERRAA